MRLFLIQHTEFDLTLIKAAFPECIKLQRLHKLVVKPEVASVTGQRDLARTRGNSRFDLHDKPRWKEFDDLAVPLERSPLAAFVSLKTSEEILRDSPARRALGTCPL
jgi:hypothetical protein